MISSKIVSIIITYNKVDPVIMAVKSILASNKYNNTDIILIDNSEDISIFENLRQKLNDKSKNIKFIKNKTNYGFSKAANQGIKIALGERANYILLLNDDAYLDENCIEYLIDALESDSEALIAGPTIFYNKYKNKVWHTGGYYNKLTSNIKIPFKNKTLDLNYFKNLDIQEVDFLTGCVLLLKRDAIEKIGFFDEDLFFYAEDLDYSLRIKKNGFKSLWVPYAFAWHDIDIEKGRTNPFVMYNLAKSNIIARKKNLSKLYYFYYLFLHFFLYTPFRLYQILKGSKNFEAFIYWLGGTLDGICFKK